MQSAISIHDVTLRYFTPQRENLALSGISLDVTPGEFVALVGASGCGKSTLLSLISGLASPSHGKIMVQGKLVNEPSPRVGYMFQRDTLLEWRTILDNVLLGAELLRLNPLVARRRAEDLLVRYGLGEFLHSLPSQLSGGMRQRAALARTLCPEPEIMLLDEPFSALDFQTRLNLADEIAAIIRSEGKTAVLVTHDIGEAVSMADRVVVMSRRPGRIKSEHQVVFPSFGPERPTPFESRRCPEFAELFQVIWDEMGDEAVEGEPGR